MKIAPIIIAILAILGLGGSAFLFTSNRTLTSEKTNLEQHLSSIEQELTVLEDKKNKVETELTVLKNTDLAKEVERLNVMLKIVKNDQTRLKTLEGNFGKIKLHLDALNAFHALFFSLTPDFKSGIEDIDAKISALNNTEISTRWAIARKDIDIERRSWFGGSIQDTLKLITTHINDFLR